MQALTVPAVHLSIGATGRNSETDPLGFLGYCPQENVLWPNLTVREHLEVFAAMRGLSKADTLVAISRYTGSHACPALHPGTVNCPGGDDGL